MDCRSPDDPSAPVLDIQAPAGQRIALVFASPHSGRCYPDAFIAQSALDPETLRRSEDSYVDELFAAATDFGAPLLKALFPRAYVDVNREPYELDPAMFDGPLPAFVNTTSSRVSAGLGTIARVVASGAEIYRRRLTFAEAERRIDRLYRPYHAALTRLLEETITQFGGYLLIDCHSMPSIGGPTDSDNGTSRVDFVLGDCFGTSCSPTIVAATEASLSRLGYRAVRNAPYAGGFTTRTYGNPAGGRHVLQIEINRRLYMNETSHAKKPGFANVQKDLTSLIGDLADLRIGEIRR